MCERIIFKFSFCGCEIMKRYVECEYEWGTYETVIETMGSGMCRDCR